MKIPFSKQFDQQRDQFSFRFTCEFCMYYSTELNGCIHEYPNEMHRLEYYDGPPPPDKIIFCKQFELK